MSMISGQKCSPEAELVAGKFGNPTFLTTYNVHYTRMKLIQVFSTDISTAFTVRRILSRVCIIGPIFFIADNDNNFEFVGNTDNYRR